MPRRKKNNRRQQDLKTSLNTQTLRQKRSARIADYFRDRYNSMSREERIKYIMHYYKVGESMAKIYHTDARRILGSELHVVTGDDKSKEKEIGISFNPMEEVKKNFDFLKYITTSPNYEAKYKNSAAKELVRMNDKFSGIIKVMDDTRLEERLYKILKEIADRLKVPCEREQLKPDIDRLKQFPDMWMPFDQSFAFDESINDCLAVFVTNRNATGKAIATKIQAVEMMNRVLENPSYRISRVDDTHICRSAVKRMCAVFGLREFQTKKCENMVLGGYWRPFQKRWIQDRSRQKIVEKSRRTGYTFASSFEWNLEALEFDGDVGIWISRSEKLAKQFSKKYLMLWTRVVNCLVEKDYISARAVTAGEVVYPNGHQLIMASSNPDSVAGFGGKIGLDEYALNPSAEMLYDIAAPAIMYGDRLQIISTHRGRGQFYHFVQDAKEKGSQWSYHRANIKDAIADGIVQVVNNEKIRKGMPPISEQEFYDEVRTSCRSEAAFLQEYMCQPADDIDAVLSYDLIRSCVAPPSSILNKDGKGRQYFGYDFGMTVNPSCMIRLEETKDSKLVVREYKFMKEKRFNHQKRLATLMMDKCHRGAMDAGAQGAQMAQEMESEYDSKFEGVMLTGVTMRSEIANLVWRFFDEGRIVIPDEDDVIEHLFAIKKEEREGSQPKIYSETTSNKDDHADFFWALGLALYAHGGYVSTEIGIRRLPNAMRREAMSSSIMNFY